MSQQPPMPPPPEPSSGDPGPRPSSSDGPSGAQRPHPRGEWSSSGQGDAADQQRTPQQPYDQQVPPSARYPTPGQAQPPSGDPAYGQQPYAQQPYGQPGHGQPGYGPAQHYPPAAGSASAGRPLSQSDENLWALLAHASIPFLGFAGPLVVYLVFKDRSRWLSQNAVEALNFSILYTIVVTACSLLSVILIGALLLPVVFTGALVFAILAAVAANRHELYRYPVNWRLVR